MPRKPKTIELNENPLASIPSYVNIPEGVFDDLEHYRLVVERVTRALATSGQKNNSRSASRSYLYDGIQIEFSTVYQVEEIFLDAFNSKIVLRAPKKKNESEEMLRARRLYYLGELLKPAEAMRTIGVAQIYLALKAEGRKQISKKGKRS